MMATSAHQQQSPSLPEQIGEELLVCRICYCRYTTEEKRPKMLTCSHTFCESCITEYFYTKPRKNRLKFPCPLCRAVTPLKEGPAKLTNNFTLLELLEIVNKQVGNVSSISPAQVGASATESKQKTPRSRLFDESHSQGGATALSHSQGGATALSHDCSQCGDEEANFALCPRHVFCEKCYMRHIDASTVSNTNVYCPVCSDRKLGILTPGNKTSSGVPMVRVTSPPTPTERPPPYNPHYSSPSKGGASRRHSSTVRFDLASCEEEEEEEGEGGVNYNGHLPPPRPPPPGRSASFRYPTRNTDSLRRGGRSRSFPMTPVGELMLGAGQPETSEQGGLTRPHSMYSLSPPKPPLRRASANSPNSPLKCIQKIGRFSQVRMQTKTFRQPTCLAISDSGGILVVDHQGMTVQVFNAAGSYISMFKVTGIQGACFLTLEKLLIATHRGVEIYTVAGEKIQDLSLGLIVNVIPYKFGFIACKMKGLVFYRASMTPLKEVSRVKTSKNPLKRGTSFKRITDIGVTSHREIVVLDSGLGEIFLLDEDCHVRAHIQPAKETCGKLNQPQGLAVDKWNGILVSDTGNRRVLKFSAHGTFSRCVLTFDLGLNPNEISPYGIRVNDQNQILLSVCGKQFAEIRIYQL